MLSIEIYAIYYRQHQTLAAVTRRSSIFTARDKIADDDLDEALGLIGQSGGHGLNTLVKLAHRYMVSDPAKAIQCVE